MVSRGSIALALYGTMAAALALAIGTDATLTTAAVIGAAVAELGAFYLMHAYVDMLGERYDHPEFGLWKSLGHSVLRDIALPIGGAPIVAIYAIERGAGVEASIGANVALGVAGLLLGAVGALAARRAQASWPEAIGEGLVAALLGAAVLLVKLLLH